MNATRAVFLDRDGVINRAIVRDGRSYPPPSLEALEVLPRVNETLHRLHQAGFRLIVATNQPDVATGAQRREVVEAIHAHLRRTLPLDDIRVCYHVDADRCACRKPKPGMLLDAARAWGVELVESYMVGDRWRDVEAGRAAGCRTILVAGGFTEPEPCAPDAVAGSLFEAGELIRCGERRRAATRGGI
jgi:D-glycero-D-manno-heptose 1,7-bisphosphate phosphatase